MAVNFVEQVSIFVLKEAVFWIELLYEASSIQQTAVLNYSKNHWKSMTRNKVHLAPAGRHIPVLIFFVPSIVHFHILKEKVKELFILKTRCIILWKSFLVI